MEQQILVQAEWQVMRAMGIFYSRSTGGLWRGWKPIFFLETRQPSRHF